MLRMLVAALAVTVSCGEDPRTQPGPASPSEPSAEPKMIPPPSLDPHAVARVEMVASQIRSRGVKDPRVLEAMERVPRHRFVAPELESAAEADGPLPIGYEVTISQPYIVALMTELADVSAGDRVLDVGTGSGYQAAVFAAMGAEVFGIEIIEPLAEQAKARLAELGYEKVVVRAGDGFAGWPEHAPFDAIVIAAAAPRVPPPLLEQLKVGGRLVLPVGAPDRRQDLKVITRTRAGYDERTVIPVRFVPMTGEVAQP